MNEKLISALVKELSFTMFGFVDDEIAYTLGKDAARKFEEESNFDKELKSKITNCVETFMKSNALF